MIRFDSQMKLGSNLSPAIQCRMMLRYLIFTNSWISVKQDDERERVLPQRT